MTIAPLVRKILLEAAESSLDVAGAALLPGAWPILKGALRPVLDRLKEQLGGNDVTSSKKLAKEAADAFEADQHLQEILRSALIEQLDQLVQGQQKIDDDVRTLMLIVSGDSQLLQDLVGGVEHVTHLLEEGVNLSEESVDKIAEAISRQAAGSREVRVIALRAMGPVADILKGQAQRLQIRAVELVQEGMADRALDELQEGLHLVATLLNEAPTDLMARLQLGFIYKTFAQVEIEVGRDDDAADYINKAEAIFSHAIRDAGKDDTKVLEIANAIHGQGNIEHTRGNLHAALASYREVLQIFPDHPYALHDIFAADSTLAASEPPNLTEMRWALDRLKVIGAEGTPGFSAQHMAELERTMRECESGTSPPRE